MIDLYRNRFEAPHPVNGLELCSYRTSVNSNSSIIKGSRFIYFQILCRTVASCLRRFCCIMKAAPDVCKLSLGGALTLVESTLVPVWLECVLEGCRLSWLCVCVLCASLLFAVRI